MRERNCVQTVRRFGWLLLRSFAENGLARDMWSTYANLRRYGMCPQQAMCYLAVTACFVAQLPVPPPAPCPACGQLAVVQVIQRPVSTIDGLLN